MLADALVTEMRRLSVAVLVTTLVAASSSGLLSGLTPSAVHAQVLIQGRVEAERHGPHEPFSMSTILAIASPAGSDGESIAFRTWETHPAGWFRLSGSAGLYTLVFSNPAHFMRPRVLTNRFLRDGDSIDLRVQASFDHAVFHDKSWDAEPATRYWQPWVASGTGVTAVGFKLATDGVDGPGPGKQDVLISVHRATAGEPPSWPRVGPTAHVPGVDCGGAKGYWYSAGWRSGEVPTTPGEKYAVSIRPADPEGRFQAFWRPRGDGTPGVYRVAGDQGTYRDRDLWLAISSDGDGLVIPYQKRVHHKFSALTRFARKWTQTWVASGRGLAGVVLYAAVSGTQPPLARQRVRVRVRRGGPAGELVGIEKIAIGNGNYTGDASWGHFVAAFAPGEVPLEPGEMYALEFESIETSHTIGGFVNIKGEESDGRVGFNPYRKCAPDDYPHGAAYHLGTEAVDYDLDLQMIEYEHVAPRWEDAVDGPDLLVNGSMEPEEADVWTPFGDATEAGEWSREEHGDRFLRLSATGDGTVDGGWVQRVSQLDPAETYRLRGHLRSTWAASVDRYCRIGFDSTGQIDDPDASTIEWTTLPVIHGEFHGHRSRPIRPRQGSRSISVWLRTRCEKVDSRFPFHADFADFSLERVASGVPSPTASDDRSSRPVTGFIDSIPPEAADAKSRRLELVRQRREYTPVLVHRGATRFAPENTLQAYASAGDRGADGIEIDIRRSRDGVLYCFHDDTLDRVTDGSGKVSEKTYFELLRYNVGSGGARIPTLAAVLTLARDRGLLLHLDVKEAGLEEEILRLIEAADLWEHIVEVNAGNAASIRGHARVRLLRYKGWFPQEEAKENADVGRRFLERPGDMVFSKGDPIDVVRALGRDERTPQPVPEDLRVRWNRRGPVRGDAETP